MKVDLWAAIPPFFMVEAGSPNTDWSGSMANLGVNEGELRLIMELSERRCRDRRPVGRQEETVADLRRGV